MCVRVRYEHRQSRRAVVSSVRRSERLLSCATMSTCLCASWRASLLVLARLCPKSYARSCLAIQWLSAFSGSAPQPCWRWEPVCVVRLPAPGFTRQSSLRSAQPQHHCCIEQRRHVGRWWSRVRDHRRADGTWSSQRASDVALPKQQVPMLRRALVTSAPTKARVSRVLYAHHRLGCERERRDGAVRSLCFSSQLCGSWHHSRCLLCSAHGELALYS